MPDRLGNDTLSFLNDVIDLDVTDMNLLAIAVSGTWTATLTWTGSVDNLTFFGIFPVQSSSTSISANTSVAYFNVAGLTRFRLTATAYTSGTAVVNWTSSDGNIAVISQLPTGGASTGIIAGSGATSLGKAEDAVANNADTGVFILGVRDATSTAVPTSTTGDYTQISTNAQGHVYVQPSATASTGNRPTQFRQIAAGSTNATSIKGTAGNAYCLIVNNTSAAIKYLKLYNKATAPTVGTDIPVLVIGVPPTSTFQTDFAGFGMSFTNGIASATTGLGTDADATAVTASDLSFTLLYF